MSETTLDAIFFDLDGTLLDTAPALAVALNILLKRRKKPPVPFDAVRLSIWGGALTILQAGFDIDEHHPEYPDIRHEYLMAYKDHLTCDTCFFPGIETVLDCLDQHAIPWGIVTNKPEWLTMPLLHHFNIARRTQCVVSGDTLPKRKPDPDQLQLACKLTNTDPKHTIYVGDTVVDVLAAKAAGMTAVAVNYGYHQANHVPSNWNADLLISSPTELITWLTQRQLIQT